MINFISKSRRTVYLASDASGQPLLREIYRYLSEKGELNIQDLGSEAYYDAAAKLATTLQKDEASDSIGVLFCGTGMGVSIVANKFRGVRAAVCENIMAAKYSRAINNANVLCLGKLITPIDKAKEIVDGFLSQNFIEAPKNGDGKTVEWWTEDTEQFLSKSMDAISEVEEKARTSNAKH